MTNFLRKHSYLLLVATTIFFSGFQNTYAQKIKNSGAYFLKKSNIGIIIKTELDHSDRSGSGGLIGAAITAARSSGKSKYDEPLKYLEPQVDPTKKLTELYKDILSKKGKIVMIIPDNVDSIKFKDFDASNAGPGKHYGKDVRFFKEKYGLDELLIIEVDYGIRIKYSYGIEIRRDGLCIIDSKIIDLANNAILVKDNTRATSHIDGDWNTPPEYLNLKNCILTAVDLAIKAEQEKYFPSPK